MGEPSKPEFDQYAGKYTELHKASIHASGEEPAFFAAYKANYMAAWIGSRASSRPLDVLDFGCGIGNSIHHLRHAFPSARLHGTDPSGESIQLAINSHAQEAAFQIIADSTLPYPDNSFDVVMAACVFHHIKPNERSSWMEQIGRVLKPGGKVFIFEHNVMNPLTVKAVKDCPFDEDAILLPRNELLGLIRESAFSGIRARYIVFFPRPLAFLRSLEPYMGWIPFGAQYVVHATRATCP